MVRAIPSHTLREPLDGTRIAANAGAIVFNAALLMLALVPLAAPKLIQETFTTVPDVVILRSEPRITPPPPPPTQPVPVTTRPAPPQPTVQPQQAADPPPVVADTPPQVGDPPGVQTASFTPPAQTLTAPPVAQGATLQALRNPAPSYPPQAVREGLTGVVELEILVGVDGRPQEVKVVRSSGHRLLDQAAVRVVRSSWIFQPALHEGQPVQALGRVPIEFKLNQ